MFDIILAMTVHILVIDGAFDVGLTAILDTLSLANELIPTLGVKVEPLEVCLVGARRHVSTAHGLKVPCAAPSTLGRADAAVVPALGAKQPAQLIEALGSKDVRNAQGLLREYRQDNALIGAACTSTFVLAEAGLLAGHRATTSWWLAPHFRQRYKDVGLEESRMLVTSHPFVTAGAALAHVDLALSLVNGRSPLLAATTARYLLVEKRASQAAFVIPDHLAHSDPLAERFERWSRSHLSQGFDLAVAASSVHSSARTLSRRIKAATGKTPLGFFQNLRLQHAVHLLETTTDSIESVAAAVGYADGVSLRALLRAKLGRGVREIRAQARSKLDL